MLIEPSQYLPLQFIVVKELYSSMNKVYQTLPCIKPRSYVFTHGFDVSYLFVACTLEYGHLLISVYLYICYFPDTYNNPLLYVLQCVATYLIYPLICNSTYHFRNRGWMKWITMLHYRILRWRWSENASPLICQSKSKRKGTPMYLEPSWTYCKVWGLKTIWFKYWVYR